MQKDDESLSKVIPLVKEYLKAMKYGSITLVVQDGKIIQVEKNEKVRI